MIDLDQIGFTQKEKEIISEHASGVSGDQSFLTNNADINEKLENAGSYFIYLFFTDEQLRKMPYVFRSKKKYQQSTFNYCKTLYAKEVGSSNAESGMMNLIRANIVRLYKAEPEAICADIAAGGKEYEAIKGIGNPSWLVGTITIKEFIGIIIDVLKFLLTLILQIVQIASDVGGNIDNTRQTRTTEEGTPSLSELDKQLNYGGSGTGLAAVPSWVWIAAGVALLAGVSFSRRD